MSSRFFAEFSGEISGNSLRATAHTFGTIAEIPGLRHLERIAPDAFKRSLSEGKDVVATWQHNPAYLLGSTKSGTLNVEVDTRGLHFEVADLPDTSYVRDLRVLMERGDVATCSFGFIPGEDTWERAPDGRQLRTHTSVSRLFDVSVVALPAFQEGTEAHLRAMTFEPIRTDLRTQLLALEARILKP